jgi:hypothetical protein
LPIADRRLPIADCRLAVSITLNKIADDDAFTNAFTFAKSAIGNQQ